jgi:hypothetical protein
MHRLEEFLNTQHSIKPTTKESYRKAIKFFDLALAQLQKEQPDLNIKTPEFEDCYLDSKIIHAALAVTEKKYEASTWNRYNFIFRSV